MMYEGNPDDASVLDVLAVRTEPVGSDAIAEIALLILPNDVCVLNVHVVPL
jgi:hypothetical protein